MLLEIVSSNKQMELLETNTKSGLLRVKERLVGMVLGGQTLARYPGRSAKSLKVYVLLESPVGLNHVSRYTCLD